MGKAGKRIPSGTAPQGELRLCRQDENARRRSRQLRQPGGVGVLTGRAGEKGGRRQSQKAIHRGYRRPPSPEAPAPAACAPGRMAHCRAAVCALRTPKARPGPRQKRWPGQLATRIDRESGAAGDRPRINSPAWPMHHGLRGGLTAVAAHRWASSCWPYWPGSCQRSRR